MNQGINESSTEKKETTGRNGWDVFLDFLSKPKFIFPLWLLLLSILVFFILLRKTGIKRIGEYIVFESFTKETILFNFSTSELWDGVGNEKYVFKGNKRLHITATGRSYSAVHHLVVYGQNDTGRIFGWTDPNGIPKEYLTRGVDAYRNHFSIIPDTNYGILLARINYFKQGRSEIIFVGREREFSLTDDAYIHFAVNEPILDNSERGKRAYVIPKYIDPDYFDRHFPIRNRMPDTSGVWQKVSRNPNLYRLWFDDNIGNFLITIEIE